MLEYTIELKHKDTGETERFGVKADNASQALGKVASGKVRFPQPKMGNSAKLTIQPFITNREYIIISVTTLGRSYPEMNGTLI